MGTTELSTDLSLRDAFGRLRVSDPFTLFDSKLLHDKQPLLFDEAMVDGSGNATSTHVAADACVEMYVEAGDSIIRQSFQRMPYQPGKSQLALLTGVLGEQSTGVTCRVGLFDDDNGVFFQYSGGVLSNVIRKGGSDTVVPQVAWNYDQLDGSGRSGIRLDEARAQIFYIDYEWLGVGTVRFGVVVDSVIYYGHLAHHANNVVSVYTSTPNYPVRYEIESTYGAGLLKHICSSVVSEGGLNPLGQTFSKASGKVDADVIGTAYALVGLRLKSDYLDAWVDLTNVSLLGATADNYLWELRLNPTVAGSFGYVDVTYGATQVATGATANTVTGGVVVASGYAAAQSTMAAIPRMVRRIGASIAGTRDTVVLCVTPLTSNADIYGSITWQELV